MNKIVVLVVCAVLFQCSSSAILNKKYSDPGFNGTMIFDKNILINQPVELGITDVSLNTFKGTFKCEDTFKKYIADNLCGLMKQTNKFKSIEIVPIDQKYLIENNGKISPEQLSINKDDFNKNGKDIIINLSKIYLGTTTESHMGLSLNANFLGITKNEKRKFIVTIFYEIWDINKHRLQLDVNISKESAVFILVDGSSIKSNINKVNTAFLEYLQQ